MINQAILWKTGNEFAAHCVFVRTSADLELFCVKMDEYATCRAAFTGSERPSLHDGWLTRKATQALLFPSASCLSLFYCLELSCLTRGHCSGPITDFRWDLIAV